MINEILELQESDKVNKENIAYLLSSVAKLQREACTKKLAYNTKEAAEAVGVKPSTIREWVRIGKIKANHNEKPVLIPVESLQEILTLKNI